MKEVGISPWILEESSRGLRQSGTSLEYRGQKGATDAIFASALPGRDSRITSGKNHLIATLASTTKSLTAFDLAE
jgi:hypothetical protein